MTDFLAEAQVLVRPDTTAFRADLLRQIEKATAGVTAVVPVTVAANVAGVAGAAAATSSLSAVQQAALASTRELDTATRVANTSWASQAVILNTVTAETALLAGAEEQLALSSTKASVSQAQLRKGFLATALSAAGARGATLAASSSFLIGAVAATAIFKSLQAFAQFQTQLRVFAATTGATADEIQRVSDAAKQLGADITLPAVSASDAAAAMTELAKAGLTVEDALAGARGVLQLSTAANIDTARAAELAANALNSFGLAGEEATRVADVLANAANSAQGSIDDFGLAFQQSSAVARQVGLSLEETAAQLTILAQNGLRGSDAGTSLRVALLRLINPTERASEVIRDLGINVRDATGNIRPDVFVQFGEATRNFTPKMRDAAFATVFGADAIRTVAIAAREGRDGLLEATEAINQTGTASELASARTSGLAGQAEALQSNLGTAAISAGKLAAVLAGPLVVAANSAVSGLNLILDPLGRVIDLVGKLSPPSFDPATASATEFLERMEELRDLLAQPDLEDSMEDLFGFQLQQAIEGAIGAFERQRAEFKAMGLDVSGLDSIIEQLQKQLDDLGTTTGPEKAAESMTPLQKKAAETREAISALASAGIDTAPLKRSLKEIEQLMASAAERARFQAAILAHNISEGLEEGFQQAPPAQIVSSQIAVAEARGQDDQLIQLLEQRRDKLSARLDALLAQPQTAEVVKKVQQAANLLASTNAQIASITNKQASDAEAAARDIRDARSKADAAILSAFDLREQERRTAIINANSTEGIKDDIRANTALRNFLTNKIAQIRKTVQDAKTKAQAIAQATAELAQVNATIRGLEDQQRDLLQQQRKDRRDAQRESLDLDIQIAQSTGNRSAEIAARNAEIKFIEDQITQTRRNSLQRKRLIAELRQAQAELRDLKEEKKKTNNELKSLQFEFLQTQQGFAANLLGNLIPGSATAGLVGGTQPSVATAFAPPPSVGAAIGATAGVAEARDRGPSKGDARQTVHVLLEIKSLLAGILAGTGHPEARFQRRDSNARLDTLH